MVTGGVAKRVIDPLEAVNVDESERERLICPLRPEDIVLEQKHARVAAVRARKFIERSPRSILCREAAVFRGRLTITCRLVPVALSALPVSYSARSVSTCSR